VVGYTEDVQLSQAQTRLLLSTLPGSTKLTLIRLDSEILQLTPHFYVRAVDVDPLNPKEALLQIFRTGN
jgi:hypothetical protein